MPDSQIEYLRTLYYMDYIRAGFSPEEANSRANAAFRNA